MHPHDLPVDRRTVLAAGAASAAGAALAALTPDEAQAAVGYFRHGVASGDPMPTSVVLWTRVTPRRPTARGQGRHRRQRRRRPPLLDRPGR
jgi:alkaline phosphatase D